jgi:hypothetical protein
MAAAIAAAALADWLLYDSWPGVSISLAFAGLAATAVLANPALWRKRKTLAAASAVLAASLLPGIEHAGALSLIFALAGTGLFALAINGHPAGARGGATALLELLVIGPFRLSPDLLRWRRAAARAPRPAGRLSWSVWFVPAGLGAVFSALFAAANPVIEQWFAKLDPTRMLEQIDMPRIGFWLAMVSLAWPFIRVRIRNLSGPAWTLPGTPAKADAQKAGALFGKAAILRSLIVFNALFAVETLLDIAYLWGGVALPEGMTYAGYAHRGAYPLIVTALLAAGFVLAAMQPGSETARSPVIRALVYLWTGQNVLLVLSSMLRLNLYAEVYSLTLLRVAAFLWMLLVALGLVLIVARVALDRSNGWLVSLNAAALAAMLYVCSFVNFPHIIASYNVAHCREVTGTGTVLDSRYLIGLGPDVIPALDAYLGRANAGGLMSRRELATLLGYLAQAHRKKTENWRSWTFGGERLNRYLDMRDAKPAVIAPVDAWDF